MEKSNINNFKIMFKLAWKQNRFFILYQFLSNTIRGPFPLLIAYLNKLIIDQVTSRYNFRYNFEYLIFTVFFIILVQILYEFLMTLDTKLSIISSNNIFVKIQDLILSKIESLDKSHYDKVAEKDIIYRGKNFDYNSIHNLINLISNILRRVFTACIAAGVLFNYDYKLTILIAIIYYLKTIFGKYSVNESQKINIKLTELNRQKEYYSNIIKSKNYLKEVRIFNSNNFFITKYEQVSMKIYKLNKNYILKNTFITSFLDLIQIIVNGILFGFLIISAYTAKITIGDINFIKSAFDNLCNELYSSISMMTSLYKDISLFDFFGQFMELKNNIINSENNELQVTENGGTHRIEFKNVYFTYPDSNNCILNDISFVIDKGESVGLIGVNGSGKSTIIKLLLRLYDCDSGSILVDDIDIKRFNPYQYYSVWGVQYQDYNLYPISVLQNIALGIKKDQINTDAVNAALNNSDSCDILQKFENGLDTKIFKDFDPDGFEPSSGEAQRLALARLFYREFEMYVLDEPSSSIDACAESVIFQKLYNMTKSKTSLIISHRLSNVKFCDKIILIEDGKIVVEGTHIELLNNKYYSKIYNAQKKSYTIENEMESYEFEK